MEDTMRFEQQLVALIKEKKELSSLDDSFVHSVLMKVLASRTVPSLEKYTSFRQFRRSSFCKSLVSDSRKYLHDIYGVFQDAPLSSYSKQVKAIRSLSDSRIDTLLKAHRSTRERFPYYPELYSKIWEFCSSYGIPSSFSVLDLACGWNPFALKHFPVLPSSYYASDLSSQDMSLMDEFFVNTGVSGRAVAYNALSSDFLAWLESFTRIDLCLLFKTLDSLEYASRNSSKQVLNALSSRCSVIVVSFSRTSIGGRKEIDAKRRSWFESWCYRNDWSFQLVTFPNEFFYFCIPAGTDR